MVTGSPSVPVSYAEGDDLDQETGLPHVKADLLDALVVAVDLFRRSSVRRQCIKKIFKKQKLKE